GRAVLALMRAEYVVNTEQWDSPSLQWNIDLTGVRARDAAVDAFVGGLSALRGGDRAAAGRFLADLTAINRDRAPVAPGQERDQVPAILEQELRALLRPRGTRPQRPGPTASCARFGIAPMRTVPSSPKRRDSWRRARSRLPGSALLHHVQCLAGGDRTGDGLKLP